ncbi:MAG: DUF2807 domain-containing protein [Croceibacterium sp.]
MRFDDLFRNLGFIAGNVATHLRDAAATGVPLAELDLTGPAPHAVALAGPGHVVVNVGDDFLIEVDEGPGREDLRFALSDGRLGLSGGDGGTRVRITLPAPLSLAVTGSGRMESAALAPDGEVSVAGSGRLEIGAVGGGRLAVHIAGSGRLTLDGRADTLELAIAGSGSCDGEGLMVHGATVNLAGSGDAIFACDGEVTASLLGSGNVIVRGSARCSVSSIGSGTLVCERAPAET